MLSTGSFPFMNTSKSLLVSRSRQHFAIKIVLYKTCSACVCVSGREGDIDKKEIPPRVTSDSGQKFLSGICLLLYLSMTGILRPCCPNTLADPGFTLCGVGGDRGGYQHYSLRIAVLVLSTVALCLEVSAPLHCCFLIPKPSDYLKALF